VRRIERSVEIDVPSGDVWKVLVDFARYPDWNPFVRSVSGEPVQGARLRVEIRPPGGRGMTFRPRVLVANPGTELRWLGRLFIPGLFDGEHSFVIEPLDQRRCRLIQSETFSGLFVKLFGKGLEKTATGFDQMNQALKTRAEALASKAA
jgi:hypothetical protein